MSRYVLTSIFLLLSVIQAPALEHDTVSRITSPFAPGSVLPDAQLTARGETVSLSSLTSDQPTIVIRFLGFGCTHCVEQLTYLNRYAAKLREMGIRVVAFSSDNQETCDKLMRRMQYDPSVMQILSDPEDQAAKELKVEDLHAAIVLRQGVVAMSVYSTQPYMDIERLVAAAAEGVVLQAAPHAIDRYLSEPFSIVSIAGPTDGINAPIDLDFNKSPLHPHDLWVVTTDSRGHGIAIVHDAMDAARRTIRLKKDSRASHFMWRTLGIAMGSNGAFATAQNGENGQGDPFYQFMGPTLWSSDTAVFASRYQEDRNILASHLDMLHQSPMGLGIAHDHDNVFWVSCGYYGDVTRYDFQDPHEVGGTDHRDGIIRRYPEATLTRGERGRPAHLALDQASGWLYYVDPGTNSVKRLQTRTGTSDTTIVPPEESNEYLKEYTGWKGATVEPYISSGLGEPVGIEVVDDRLLIGDRQSGKIHVFAITALGPERLGEIETMAQELLGICLGPDGRIWFVDRGTGTIQRLTFASEPTLTAHRDVQVAAHTDTVRFSYSNISGTERTATFNTYMRTINERGEGAWRPTSSQLQQVVAASGPTEIAFEVTLTDTVNASEIMIEEFDNSTNIGGVRASTFLIPRSIQRAVVDDAQTETFRIGEAVEQTERPGYSRLRSDLFLRAVDSLPKLQTVLWNGGSFGEINVADDAIIMSLLKRKIDVFLIADDPLILRTDMPNSLGFFSSFGTSYRGADLQGGAEAETGQRVFFGLPGDSVSGGMTPIDCQLPRLNHHRGGEYVPNVHFRGAKSSSGTAVEILMRMVGSELRVGSVRYEHPNYRSIIVGINASRFLDGAQRTTLLRNGLVWLEAAAEKEVVDTVTGVDEEIAEGTRVQMIAHSNPVTDNLVVTVRGVVDHVDIGLYSVTGQRLATLATGSLTGSIQLSQTVSSLSTGTYFLVARTATTVDHLTIIKR